MNSNEIVDAICETLGNDLHPSVESFVYNMFDEEPLTVGKKKGGNIIAQQIRFNPLVRFDDLGTETVLNDKYKPKSFLVNDYDHYFPIKEVIEFSNKENYFGIIGSKWFKNEVGHEFVEAIVFGDHYVRNLDCVLGSILVNHIFGFINYITPGAIVSLNVYDFKNSTYLMFSKVLTRIHVSCSNNSCWKFNEPRDVYCWNRDKYELDEYSEED